MRRLILVFAFVIGATTLPALAHTAQAQASEANAQPTVYVQTFYLTHAKAQEVQFRLLYATADGAKPSVTIDSTSNSVTVRATESVLKSSAEIIRQLDVPQATRPASATPPAPAPPKPTPPPAAAQAPPAPPAPPSAPSLSLPSSQLVPAATNIKLTLAITDSFTGTPVTKEMSLMMLQRSGGMIRTSGNSSSGFMNVDAVATAYLNGAVSLKLTFDYQGAQPGQGPLAGVRPPAISESLTVVLQDGKPLTVSETADPGSDRRVTVTLTATILK